MLGISEFRTSSRLGFGVRWTSSPSVQPATTNFLVYLNHQRNTTASRELHECESHGRVACVTPCFQVSCDENPLLLRNMRSHRPSRVSGRFADQESGRLSSCVGTLSGSAASFRPGGRFLGFSAQLTSCQNSPGWRYLIRLGCLARTIGLSKGDRSSRSGFRDHGHVATSSDARRR